MPIGYVIHERIAPEVYEISVALIPEERGKGKGKQLTSLGTSHCIEEMRARKVVALVFPENRASVRTFKEVGYVENGQENGVLRFVYE